MSGKLGTEEEQIGKTSKRKKKRKPFLFVEVILVSTAIILSVINVIRWSTDLPFMSMLITMLVGIVFILRGVEFRLNKEKGYKITIILGFCICIISGITLILNIF